MSAILDLNNIFNITSLINIRNYVKNKKEINKENSTTLLKVIEFAKQYFKENKEDISQLDKFQVLREIVILSNFSNEMNQLGQDIVKLAKTQRFGYSIYLLNNLMNRQLQNLEQQLEELTVFPYSYDKDLKAEENLLEKLAALEKLDKSKQEDESWKIEGLNFYLLADKIKPSHLAKLNSPDFYIHNGTFPSLALWSFERALRGYVINHHLKEDSLSSRHLQKFGKARGIQLKLELLDQIFAQKKSMSMKEYYQLLYKYHFAFPSLKDQQKVPPKVLINNIAWEIKKIIDDLKPGDFQFFSFGTFYHAVIIEISRCHQADSCQDRDYIYRIFNTGEGVQFHDLADNECSSVYPAKISSLSKEAFSYSFIKELILLNSLEEDMNLFYEKHWTYLIERGQGVLSFEDYYHPQQSFDDCATSAIRAYLMCKLSEEDFKGLSFVQSLFVIDDQKKF